MPRAQTRAGGAPQAKAWVLIGAAVVMVALTVVWVFTRDSIPVAHFPEWGSKTSVALVMFKQEHVDAFWGGNAFLSSLRSLRGQCPEDFPLCQPVADLEHKPRPVDEGNELVVGLAMAGDHSYATSAFRNEAMSTFPGVKRWGVLTSEGGSGDLGRGQTEWDFEAGYSELSDVWEISTVRDIG
jgi:hypothetical protein